MSTFYLPYHIFICPECDKNNEMEHDKRTEMDKKEFIAHLKDVHKIDKPKGKRSLMMHMSKEPRHCSSYEWTIEGKTFYEYYG